MKKLKFGFTLAEVLITVGIIGVVSAITIPMLVTNYQKRLTITRLKKVYSHLNQVIKLIDEEQGLAVLSGSSANFVPKYILPHYNGATLFPPTNYKKTMCFNPSHYYLGAKNNDAQYAWTTGYGSYISTPFGSTTSIELPDGTCIGFNTLVNSNYYPDTTIFVDVNGSATPPNRSGRDLFLFYLDENTGSIQPANKSMGGINWAKDGARKIIDDGWKITKSYRW